MREQELWKNITTYMNLHIIYLLLVYILQNEGCFITVSY
jgi:hypothetical protein